MYHNATDIVVYIFYRCCLFYVLRNKVSKLIWSCEVTWCCKENEEKSIHKWVKDRGNISANDVIYIIFVLTAYSYITDIHLDM